MYICTSIKGEQEMEIMCIYIYIYIYVHVNICKHIHTYCPIAIAIQHSARIRRYVRSTVYRQILTTIDQYYTHIDKI